MLIVEKRPRSMTAEAFRTLRTNIQYSSFDKDIRTILVTSSVPGEGKTTVSGNLALTFAQAEKKVILIDCDLRKPAVHREFKISNMIGLSDVLVGEEKLKDGIYEYNENLHVLTSGKIPPNPSEMVGSRAMEKLLEELKNEYDIIILDTAPLIAVTDGQILSTKVDGTLLTVRAGITKREAVISSKSLLDKVNAKVIGTVLNGVEPHKDKHYYYYGTKGK